MKRKTAERELKIMANRYGLFSHKFRDRGYISCPTCHKAMITCPFCRSDMLMPKAQSYPDYLLVEDPIFIEVKWGKQRFPLEDISPIQRKSLTDNGNSWVFVVIGEGRVPNGRGAWLVPWDEYQGTENTLASLGIKSLIFEKTSRSRVPEADDYWIEYRLEWEDGGWNIPAIHIWWATNLNMESESDESAEQTIEEPSVVGD